jgi:hypothetical protein
MSDFLTSGRRTRFAPSKVSTRPAMDRTAHELKVEPTVARDMANAARGMLENQAFVTVLQSMAGKAYERFETSPPGPTGSERRDIAHMQIKALELIVEDLRAMEADAALYDKIEQQQAEHD